MLRWLPSLLEWLSRQASDKAPGEPERAASLDADDNLSLDVFGRLVIVAKLRVMSPSA